MNDFEQVLADPVLRRTLAQRSWLPVRHGAMLKVIPVHQKNELYETDMAIFMLKHPFRRRKSATVRDLLDEPRNTELEANLLHFQELYRRILAERPSDWQAVAEDTADRRARAHYYRHIEAQLEDVNEKLGRLRAMGAGAASR